MALPGPTATSLVDRVVRPHVAHVEDVYLNSKNALGTTESYVPSQLPAGISRVVSGILSLFEARGMAEHCQSMPLMAKNIVWDAPGFILSRKGSVRVSAYLSKFIVRQRFVPSLVQVESRGVNRHVVDVSGTLQLLPHRTIFLPATLLLPQSIPIRATISIGVDGPLDSGVVELVALKFHNLPALPNFMRAANGLAFGVLPHVTEPLWSFLPDFIGDDFYSRKREATFAARHPQSQMPLLDSAKDVVTDTASGLMDYGVDTVHNTWDGVSYVASNFLEAVGYGLGRARATAATAADVAAGVAGTTYNTATSVASTTYNTAANVAGRVYDTATAVGSKAAETAAGTAGMAYGAAASAAGTAYETAAQVGSKAADTAAGTAGMAYGAATNAAGTAYDTAAGAAQGAYEVGRETAQAGRDTARSAADQGVRRADQAADDLRRGYEMGKTKPVTIKPTTASTTTTTNVTLAPSGVSR